MTSLQIKGDLTVIVNWGFSISKLNVVIKLDTTNTCH